MWGGGHSVHITYTILCVEMGAGGWSMILHFDKYINQCNLPGGGGGGGSN